MANIDHEKWQEGRELWQEYIRSVYKWAIRPEKRGIEKLSKLLDLDEKIHQRAHKVLY